MQNFLISFNVVFPIFLMMVLGFSLKKLSIMNDTTVKQMNNVIFRVFLPVMIFKNIYESEFSQAFNPKLIIFAVSAVIICIGILFVIIPITVKENTKRGVLIQAIFRSNFVIFGLPVTEALCAGAAIGSASVLIAIIVPIFNFAAVITLEVFNNRKPNIFKILKGIVTNPLIISSVLGLIICFCNISFPTVIEKAIGSISSITTPLALIMLGASIHFKTVGSNLKYLVIGLISRLILIPAICLGFAAYVFNFRGAELAIILSLFASPTAVSSFTMAQQMGGDDELAGQLVMFGTCASVVTVFMWILITVQLGLL